jgi:hypothetical protein
VTCIWRDTPVEFAQHSAYWQLNQPSGSRAMNWGIKVARDLTESQRSADNFSAIKVLPQRRDFLRIAPSRAGDWSGE